MTRSWSARSRRAPVADALDGRGRADRDLEAVVLRAADLQRPAQRAQVLIRGQRLGELVEEGLEAAHPADVARPLAERLERFHLVLQDGHDRELGIVDPVVAGEHEVRNA